MKNLLPLIATLVFAMQLQAQNKTFSIGATTPNLNASLHVESPTNNQGVLMPRLTTAQRTAMSLTAADIGLQLYDTDLKGIYAWDGTGWRNGGLVLPLLASVSSTTSAVDIANTGTGSAGNFTINNPANVKPAVLATSNSNTNSGESDAVRGIMTGTGGAAGSFTINNATNNLPALFSATNGTGNAGVFQNTNTANLSAALFATTNGNSNAGYFAVTNATATFPAIFASTNGNNPGVWGETSTGWAAIYGKRTGTGNGNAGAFEITNAANTFPSLYSSTIGSGQAMFGITTGTGSAGGLTINNAANASASLFATTNGTGNAGRFTTTNAASTSDALYATTNSNSADVSAIQGVHSGGGIITDAGVKGVSNGAASGLTGLANGTGSAGYFNVFNNASTAQAVRIANNGLGRGLSVTNFLATNPTSALSARTNGTGSVADFFSSNAAATSTAVTIAANSNSAGGAVLLGTQSGTGDGGAYFKVQNTANAFPAVQGSTTGAGNAGAFIVDNPANSVAAVYATTNGGNTAGYFEITGNNVGRAGTFVTNNLNGANTIFATSNSNNSLNATLYAERTGSAGGAAAFNILNVANTDNAVFARTLGTGNAALFNHAGPAGNIVTFQYLSLNVARIDRAGKGFFNGGTQNSGADIAEMFDVEGTKSEYEPGDVLVISESTDRTVEKSSEANSTKVVGVYATKPGVTLTEKDIEENLDQLVPMGVIGVIPTKVCLENGPIKRGDLLVTSTKKGHAMKAVSAKGDGMFPAGTVLGKALENFDGTGTGLIKVLVNVK